MKSSELHSFDGYCVHLPSRAVCAQLSACCHVPPPGAPHCDRQPETTCVHLSTCTSSAVQHRGCKKGGAACTDCCSSSSSCRIQAGLQVNATLAAPAPKQQMQLHQQGQGTTVKNALQQSKAAQQGYFHRDAAQSQQRPHWPMQLHDKHNSLGKSCRVCVSQLSALPTAVSQATRPCAQQLSASSPQCGMHPHLHTR